MWKRTLLLVAAVALVGTRTAPRLARADDAATGNYSAAELKELVAPVALYPDVVIASLLPATTFPADITAASGVIAQNGGAVSEVPAGVTWDPSVQTLLQFPDVLVWLKDNPDWVAQMGFAISVQQSEVMAAIQAFRVDCKNAGNLNSDTHQTVSTQDASDGGGAEVIVIEPSDPAVVYVPTYSPTAVMQPGYAYPWGAGFAMGVAGAWAYNNINWGSNGGDINVNRNTNINTGNVNAGNNVGPNRGSKWNASNKPAARPNGAVNKPNQGNWGSAGGKPKGGGVKPRTQGAGAGAARPGGAKPSTMPANRPSAGGGSGGRPSAPSNRPAAKPASPSRPPSAVGGAGSSGASTRASSDRGGSSLNKSGGGSSGGASRGQSGRSSGGGGGGRSSGGGGGGRGGGGGGGRRR